MSFRASEWAVRRRAGSAINKAVLLVLAEAADADGVCWLSQSTVAERAECSPRAVYSALAKLTQAGLIERRRRADSRGHRTSDLITLTIGQVAQDASRSEPQTAQDAGRDEGPTRTSCTAYSHVAPTLLAPGAKEPVIEPVNEPVTSVTPLPPVGRFMVEGLSGELLTVEGAFELWWAEWPNKTKRKEAAQVFGRILRKREATLAELVDRERRYAQTDRVRRGFVQHATTWLRGEGWKDEHPAPAYGQRQGWTGLDQAIEGLSWGDNDPFSGGVA